MQSAWPVLLKPWGLILGIGADEAVDQAVQVVEALQVRIGIAKSISNLAKHCLFYFNENVIDKLVEHASQNLCCASKPVNYSPYDFSAIYLKAWK